MKDLQEKQDLLCQASKALELLDDQKGNDYQHSQMLIEELNQKIESLQHEVSSLQNALVDANKSVLANDTGYADFLGAVDTKDVEVQRKMIELTQIETSFNQRMVDMNEKVKDLQFQKKEIEAKAASLMYENDEMKDKMSSVEQQMIEQVRILFLLRPTQPFLLPLQLKKFKVLRNFCNEKLANQNFARFENHFLVKRNKILSEQLENSMLSQDYRQLKDNEFLVI